MAEYKRHPLAIAWDYWLASDEGKDAAQPNLQRGEESRQYLENRLYRAFLAGSIVRDTLCGNCGNRYVSPWEDDKHGTDICNAKD